MPTEPLAISDSSLLLLLQLANPLAQDDRGRFLADVADRLKGEPEPGDGVVARAARAAQSRYLRPPETVELRRVPSSRIAGARLHKPNGNGGG